MEHHDELDGLDWVRRHQRWERRLDQLHRIAGVPVPTYPPSGPFGVLRDLWR